ncbi:MAG: hypothetical protein IPJ45_09460 [Ignavibacteria bacterium]|nr:hypothetical protein [Ignavibacteria bacterium]
MAETKKYICIERFWEEGAQYEPGQTVTGLPDKRLDQLKGTYIESESAAEKILKAKRDLEARLASIGA